MPKRPFRRSSYPTRTANKRHRSANTIKKAWKNWNRKKQSLNTRTTLANRRSIQQIKKARETHWITSTQGNSGNLYAGQYTAATQVDSFGLDTNAPAVPYSLRVLRGISAGAGNNQRVGDWIQIKSVTVHAKFLPPGAAPATEHFNRLRILCVLDREPLAMMPGTGQPNTPRMVNLKSTDVTSDMFMNYFNPVNTGKEGRFKVLAVKTAHVGYISSATGYTTTTFPAEQNFTFNFGRGFKINYQAGTDVPVNQELVVMAHSDSRVAPHPYVELKCKVRYYDS